MIDFHLTLKKSSRKFFQVDDFFPIGIGIARIGIRLFVVMVVVEAKDEDVDGTGEAITSFDIDRRREILLLDVGVSERIQGIDA